MKLLTNFQIDPSIRFHSSEITQDERPPEKNALTPSARWSFSVNGCIEGSSSKKIIVSILYSSLLAFSFVQNVKADASQEPIELIQQINVTSTSIEIVPQEFKGSFYRFNFKMELDSTNLDLRQLPHSIVTIPFILSSLPFIWGSEKTFIVDEIDEDLYISLERLNLVFKLFYPTHSWSGKLLAKKIVKNNNARLPHDQHAVLFSHGLDSVSASFETIDKAQLLITVCGNDIDLGDTTTWHNVKQECSEYAHKYNKKNIFIRSNCRFFCHTKKLSDWCRKIYNPWSSALSSFGLAGLAAPIISLTGHSTVLMGSTRTSDFPHPLGSHPLLDNNITFCGASLHHAQPESDRVEKIKSISNQVQKYQIPYPLLRVCFTEQKKNKGNNCGNCSRCLRTIMEIVAANEQPQHFGFLPTVLDDMQPFYTLFKGAKLTGGEVWHWMCIQKQLQQLLEQPTYIYKKHTELTEFLRWLIDANLALRSKNNLDGLKGQHAFFYDLWQLGKQGISDVATLTELERKIPRSRRR